MRKYSNFIPEKVPAWIGGMSRSADPAGELQAAKGGFSGTQGTVNQAGAAGLGKVSEGVAKAKAARAERAAAAQAESAAANESGGEKNYSSAKTPNHDG